MLRNFLSTGEMTQSEVDAFLKVFHDEKNFEYDDNPDYISSFMKTDVFLADMSSLLIEEFITGKPIIYLGTTNQFNEDFMNISKIFYSVKNSKQLIAELEKIIAGSDDLKLQRQEYIYKHMMFDGKIGQRIINYLKEDFTRNE